MVDEHRDGNLRADEGYDGRTIRSSLRTATTPIRCRAPARQLCSDGKDNNCDGIETECEVVDTVTGQGRTTAPAPT